MKLETKIILSRQKYYFDLGANTTSYLIKVLILVGFAAILNGMSTLLTFVLGTVYAMFCYALGYCMVRYEWVTASLEVSNRLNLFMLEVRDKLK